MTGTSFVLKLVPLKGENEFAEPHPQNEFLILFRGRFLTITPVTFIWESPPPVGVLHGQVLVCCVLQGCKIN